MYYILADDGYIDEVSFGNNITCKSKTCTEYTGNIPTGYSSLEDWNEHAVIQAYNLVGGNLTYDSAKETTLLQEWENQLKTYSTTEQRVGTWIDGKPIYRKVIQYTSALVSGSNNIPHNISNFSTIIKANGIIPFGTGSYLTGAYENATTFVTINNVNASTINIRVGSSWGSSFTNGCIVTIEYTKTTD